jgi:hypothetical protein
MSPATDEPASLLVRAVVAATERAAVVAGLQQLGESTRAAGFDLRIGLNFLPSFVGLDVPAPRSIVIASLLPDLFGEEAWPQTQGRWRAQVAPIAADEAPPIFLCNVFRYVAGNPRHPSVERIRRLNLLAIELSHDFGLNIVDIDRVFAHLGAQELRTDCRLTGPIAAEVAGYVIVDAILATMPDHLIPPEVQDVARRFQGPVEKVRDLVARRLRPRQTGPANGQA